VSATRGEAGEPVPKSVDGADLGTVRAAELRRATAERLGVQRVELLGYRDAGFDGDDAEPRRRRDHRRPRHHRDARPARGGHAEQVDVPRRAR
jgi:LmbE family N-acetylglucosaminyl deacetylase